VKRQQIPNLAQQFTADFALVVDANTTYNQKPYTLSGKVALDFVNSGLYFSLEDISGVVPFSLASNFVISPDADGINVLFTDAKGDCWNVFFFQWIFTYLLPPFAIPPDATYVGEAVINGDKCSIWNYWWGSRSITVFVRESDGVLVKGLHFEDPTWTNQEASWTLTNIELKVDPAIYSLPPSCSNIATWNPNFQSHLPWYWCDPFCDYVEPMKRAARSAFLDMLF